MNLKQLEWHKLSEYSKMCDVDNPYSRLSLEIYKSCNRESYKDEDDDIYALLDAIYTSDEISQKKDLTKSDIKNEKSETDGFIYKTISKFEISGENGLITVQAEQKTIFNGTLKTIWNVIDLKTGK